MHRRVQTHSHPDHVMLLLDNAVAFRFENDLEDQDTNIARLLDAVENLKHRAIILLTYSGGLRLGEVVRLKVEDIDLDRKLVHVRQGKHRKDRYTMLSAVAQKAVQDYRRQYPPETWLFPGARPGRHFPTCQYRVRQLSLRV